MAAKIGPRITTDGLLTYWDSANFKSYPESGNVWYDLGGNDHHAYGDPGGSGSGFSDSRFPVWEPDNGGRFYFDGTDGLTVLTDMGAHTILTADFWCYKTGATETTYLFDGRNDGGQWWIANYPSPGANIEIHATLRASQPSTYQTDGDWWDQWINIIITSNSGGSALWVNGEAITDSRLALSNSVTETLGQYFRIGNRFTSAGRWEGYWSNLRFYNRVLTNSEIISNFNSLRGRFGV